jgi:tetratricopeptide (TPR) repeat protein
MLCAAATSPATSPAGVTVTEKDINIPTYLVGDPEPNPMFYFGRQSQGAQAPFYPYPMVDSLSGKKADKTYKIVYLENEYLRIGILPEIGGRIFEGVDKTNGYNFIYRQHVIKPTLISILGAWISGGVEWNIPHHHRATSFLPIEYKVEEAADGSRTVWIGELEIRDRMRWAVGYTLRPGKSVLEARLRILNRTPVETSMLCFANVAVHVGDQYQVIFPPSTQYGTGHFKRTFQKWPIADKSGEGAAQEPIDISWWKNHPGGTSVFAWNYEDDFVAGYDHGKQAGTMSVTDHNIVPGKKFFEWGAGTGAQRWDRDLTDGDGPYIELMVGAYSDNQPDYSWMQPYETRAFSMNWYPFRDIGGVKKANLDAAVNLTVRQEVARMGFNTTSAHAAAKVILKAGEKVLFSDTVAINPGKPYLHDFTLPAGVDENDLSASLSVAGKELVSYTSVRPTPQPEPKGVAPAPPPADIKTNEELYLTGLRAKQFHDPVVDPEPYWQEALRRDPGDARVNTSLGISRFKTARFAEAEQYLRRAVERLTDRYTSPKDTEAMYYLGATLKAEGKLAEANKWLYKCTWAQEWRAPGYYGVAEIAATRGDLEAALDFAGRSIDANALNIRAQNLKAALLRHLGRPQEAAKALAAAHDLDPLDVRSMAERWLGARDAATAGKLFPTMNRRPETAQETAAEYMNAGLWQDGSDVLRQLAASAAKPSGLNPAASPAGPSGLNPAAAPAGPSGPNPAASPAGPSSPNPMVYYYLSYFADKLGNPKQAAGYRTLAMAARPDYVFPFQYEAIEVLRQAIQANPADARAPYYLGNLLFDWQPEEAVKLWTVSAKLDPSFAIAHRNLATAYAHRKPEPDLPGAIAELEKAVSLPVKYPLHFTELDELYEQAGTPIEKRLPLFEANRDVVARRDDAQNRAIALKIAMNQYDEAIAMMTGRKFASAEGANLNVAEHWTAAHLYRGQDRMNAGKYQDALADFQAAVAVPENLPGGGDFLGRGNQAEAAYWTGAAYEALGDHAQAMDAWNKAASSTAGARGAQVYFRALCMQKVGQGDKAKALFEGLLEGRGTGTAQPERRGAGQQSARARQAAAHYAAALGHLGLNDWAKAKDELRQAVDLSPDLLGARKMLASMK